MARRINWWLAAALLACLVAGLVYLPPKGMPKWAWGGGYVFPPESEARARARQLAFEWRQVNAALVGARYHDQYGPRLAERRAGEIPGPLLTLTDAESLPPKAATILQDALDSAWARLGIGVGKVSVGVIAGAGLRLRSATTPPVNQGQYGVTYLLPDSTDRATCLALVRVPVWLFQGRFGGPGELRHWAATVLGPCAFYARFGVPSPRVEHWLAGRSFDVALAPVWRSSDSPTLPWRITLGEGPGRWWWYAVYSYPRSTMACFAGRETVCSQILRESDQEAPGPRPRVVVPLDPWDFSKVRLVGSETFLSDVLRKGGEERFQEFWTTTLPVDSALTLALKRPVGEWTAEWQRRLGPGPRFGATARGSEALFGIAFAGFMVGLVLLGQGRREVR